MGQDIGRPAAEVWMAEAQIVPADDDTQTVHSTVSTHQFLSAVGATEHSVLGGAGRSRAAHEATIRHWQEHISAGKPFHVSIHYDSMGNIIGADGRHRAIAALRSGQHRIHVHITRRK